jgi:hypothetical protein
MIIVRRSARSAPELAAVPVPEPEVSTAAPAPPAELNGHGHAALEAFADDISAGTVPGIRRIRREIKVGQPRAQAIRDYLSEVAAG